MRGYEIQELEVIHNLLSSSRLNVKENDILQSIVQRLVATVGCDRNNCPYVKSKGGNCVELICNCTALNITKTIKLEGWPARFKDCPYFKYTKINEHSRYCDENGIYTPVQLDNQAYTPVKKDIYINPEVVIVSLIKASNKKYVTIGKIFQFISYAVSQLRENKELAQEYSVEFNISYDSIETTVLYNDMTFDLINDMVILKGILPKIEQDIPFLDQIVEQFLQVCPIK